jgi:hypothetical protein
VRGERLRTFVTEPKPSNGKVPALFFVGRLSCCTMESSHPASDDGFGIFLRRLADGCAC